MSESACPFCGAVIEARSPRAWPLLGKVTRAAVFASASASAACWSNSAPPRNTPLDDNHQVANHGSGAPADDLIVPAPSTGFASIAGVCTDAATGQLMVGASVQIYPGSGPGGRSLKTDAQGRYYAKDLAPGPWGIQCRAPGDPGRMAPKSFYADLRAGDAKRVDATTDNRDWSNVPMPYGAPPSRRRVV